MAANTVGHPQTDHLRTMGLVEAGLDVRRRGAAARRRLRRQGARRRRRQSSGRRAQARFTTVKHAKPPASRKGSSEWYVVAQGFKGS
jgi:23S rRNA (uridine2552-2'-O)-methyltransferase